MEMCGNRDYRNDGGRNSYGEKKMKTEIGVMVSGVIVEDIVMVKRK